MAPAKAAIIGFGRYLPRFRLSAEDIARHRGTENAGKQLGIVEKTVPDAGEDSFTLAFEASRIALQQNEIAADEIRAVYVGSESHPYAVKPTASMLSDALKTNPFCFAADLEFACKAGTAAMQIVQAMVESGKISCGLAVGTDTAQSRPGDALEYSAAAGAAAFLIGSDKRKTAIARIDATLSYTTDTPDFWRAAGQAYPEHAGRFTGEPGYFHHVRTTLAELLTTQKIAVKDVDHLVLHMPNGKFPQKIAKEFGFTEEQTRLGFIVPQIGNTYSACSPLGLTFVLEEAKKGDTIVVVSYGSGSGCDAFALTMLKDGVALPKDPRATEYISYADYVTRTPAHAA